MCKVGNTNTYTQRGEGSWGGDGGVGGGCIGGGGGARR